jgi:hypothetical protein
MNRLVRFINTSGYRFLRLVQRRDGSWVFEVMYLRMMPKTYLISGGINLFRGGWMTAYAMVHKHAISFRIMPDTWLTKLPGEL